MKKLLTFGSLICLTNHLYTLEISEQELAKTFEKNCRQSISSGISIGNNNINVCNLVYINNFPKKSKEQLKELNQKIMQLKKEILHLKNKKNTTVINKTETTIIKKKEITIIKNKKEELSKIKKELKYLRKRTLQNNQKINNVQKSLTKGYQIYLQEIKANYQTLDKEIQKAIEESNLLQKELNLLKNRVKKLEGRVGGIEEQVKETKIETDKNSNFIQRYVKHINAHFKGLSLIGAKSIEDNPKNSLNGVAFEYEGYNSDNNSYIFGNIFYGELEQELQYKTLEQALETEESSNSLWGVELGYRQQFTSKKVFNWTPYSSLSVGYVSGNGSNFLAKIGIGMEYQYKSDKFLVEMGYSYIGVEQTNKVIFNPLGNASSENTNNISLPYVSVKYLWRF